MKKNTRYLQMLRRYFKDPLSAAAFIIFLVIVVLCMAAPLLTSYDPTVFDFNQAKLPPGSPGHLLGTDNIGRDLFARILYGGRATLTTALQATILSAVVGTIFGIYAGYFNNTLSNLILRATEIIDSIPYILLVIMFEYMFGFGQGSFKYGLGVAAIPAMTQTVRAEVLRIKNKEYMEAARALGLSNLTIIRRHVLNNIAGTIVMQTCTNYAEAALACTVLGYLSIGFMAPKFDWGTLVSAGFNFLRTESYISLIPTFVIVITSVCLNLIGKGIRDVYGNGERA